jgi:hypothetical protein
MIHCTEDIILAVDLLKAACANSFGVGYRRRSFP